MTSELTEPVLDLDLLFLPDDTSPLGEEVLTGSPLRGEASTSCCLEVSSRMVLLLSTRDEAVARVVRLSWFLPVVGTSLTLVATSLTVVATSLTVVGTSLTVVVTSPTVVVMFGVSVCTCSPCGVVAIGVAVDSREGFSILEGCSLSFTDGVTSSSVAGIHARKSVSISKSMLHGGAHVHVHYISLREKVVYDLYLLGYVPDIPFIG